MECPYGFEFGKDFDEDDKCDECAERNDECFTECEYEWENR